MKPPRASTVYAVKPSPPWKIPPPLPLADVDAFDVLFRTVLSSMTRTDAVSDKLIPPPVLLATMLFCP
jgi:hypothetical protein